jgi:antitoxin CptB
VETAENRLRRMRVRAWHRGIREMDLVLGGFADAGLAELEPGLLDAFDTLLSENDHDLYGWIAGRGGIPVGLEEIVGRIRRHRGLA